MFSVSGIGFPAAFRRNWTTSARVQAFVGSYVKQWDLILTAALLAMLPMIIIFLIAQKQIMSGMVEGAVK